MYSSLHKLCGLAWIKFNVFMQVVHVYKHTLLYSFKKFPTNLTSYQTEKFAKECSFLGLNPTNVGCIQHTYHLTSPSIRMPLLHSNHRIFVDKTGAFHL